MQEIITAFGIDWRLLIIQGVNFAILLLALWYFLYTPILRILEERRKKIEEGVKDAEAAALARRVADEEKGKILSSAHTEAEEVVARAREHAKEEGKVILKSAESGSERILESAEARAKEIAERARKESEADIARLALLTAEKILREKQS